MQDQTRDILNKIVTKDEIKKLISEIDQQLENTPDNQKDPEEQTQLAIKALIDSYVNKNIQDIKDKIVNPELETKYNKIQSEFNDLLETNKIDIEEIISSDD